MRFLTVVGLVLLTAAAMAADVVVPVYVNNQKQDFTGLMRDGKTFAPLRAGATAIGATTKWDPALKQAIVCIGDRCTAIKESQGINVNGRLLIPLRLMGEALGCTVNWDARAHAVMINRPHAATFR